MRHRIVFDMTFADKSLTGTRVYAGQLQSAVQSNRDYEVLTVSAASSSRSYARGDLLSGMRNVFWLQWSLPWKLRSLKADLVHAPAFLSPWFAPCPVVLNVLDTIYLLRPADFDFKWRLYARFLIPFGVRRAAAIVTLSDFSKNQIVEKYRVPRERINVIYPAPDPRFKPQSNDACAAIKQKYGLDDSFCLFVGLLEKRKNVVELVKAMARLRNRDIRMQLVLVGPPGTAASAVEQAIAENRLDNVRHLGFVPAEDLPSLYASARLLVFPSLLEGFGVPLLEAMASGTPIVAVPCPPIPEVVGDAALLASGTDAEALAEAMARVVTNAELAGQLGSKGLARVKQFSLARMAEQTAALYERVLASREAGK